MPYLEAPQTHNNPETRPTSEIAQVRNIEHKARKSKLGPEIRKTRTENKDKVIFTPSSLENAKMGISSLKSNSENSTSFFVQFGSVGRLILEGNSTKIESSLFTGIGALTKLNEVPAMVDQQIRDLREKTAKAQSGNAVIIKESVEPLVANQGENVQTSPDILGILAARGYKIQDGKVSKPK